jgi:hypothetical protein
MSGTDVGIPKVVPVVRDPGPLRSSISFKRGRRE